MPVSVDHWEVPCARDVNRKYYAHQIQSAEARAAEKIGDINSRLIEKQAYFFNKGQIKDKKREIRNDLKIRIRRSMQPLADLVAAESGDVLGITHFSKNFLGKDPVDRVTGSLAYGAAARIVLGCGKERGRRNARFLPREIEYLDGRRRL